MKSARHLNIDDDVRSSRMHPPLMNEYIPALIAGIHATKHVQRELHVHAVPHMHKSHTHPILSHAGERDSQHGFVITGSHSSFHHLSFKFKRAIFSMINLGNITT